jgi:hypothetical protein
MAKDTINATVRFDPAYHEQLSLFLVKLRATTGEKISIQQYALDAIKEKMGRDIKIHNIKI